MISLIQKEINKYVLFSLVAVFSLSCFHQKIPAKLNLDFNNSLILSDESQFKNMSQLTFSGENAEAYFSADGKILILISILFAGLKCIMVQGEIKNNRVFSIKEKPIKQ